MKNSYVILPLAAIVAGGIGLDEYVDAFVENAVDFELLSHLNNEDLKDLGISKLTEWWLRSYDFLRIL